MTLIEAKEFLRNKYYKDCTCKEDVQKVIGNYAEECFGQKNMDAALAQLKKIQRTAMLMSPKGATEKSMNYMFTEFDKVIKKKKLAIVDDFSATTFIIMTILSAEIEEEFDN